MDEKLADDEVIGSGPYKVSDYKAGEQATLEINEEYTGDSEGKAPQVFVSYYQDPGALKLAVEDGDVDIAYRSLEPDRRQRPQEQRRSDGRRGRRRRDPLLGCRSSVTRCPSSLPCARRSLRSSTVRRSRRPPTTARSTRCTRSFRPAWPAATRRSRTSTATPQTWTRPSRPSQTPESRRRSTITLGYTPTHYGPERDRRGDRSPASARGERPVQGRSSSSTEWEQYQTIAKEGAYDFYSYGWFPDFLDADNYLAPFMVDGGFFQNGYTNPEVNDMVAAEKASSDQDERQQIFGDLQNTGSRGRSVHPQLGRQEHRGLWCWDGRSRRHARPVVHLPALDHQQELGVGRNTSHQRCSSTLTAGRRRVIRLLPAQVSERTV